MVAECQETAKVDKRDMLKAPVMWLDRASLTLLFEAMNKKETADHVKLSESPILAQSGALSCHKCRLCSPCVDVLPPYHPRLSPHTK